MVRVYKNDIFISYNNIMLMVQTLCSVEIFGLSFLEQLNKNDIFSHDETIW